MRAAEVTGMRVCVFMNVSRHQGGAERRIARYCSYIAEHLDVDISMLLQGDEEHVDSFRRKYLRDGWSATERQHELHL